MEDERVGTGRGHPDRQDLVRRGDPFTPGQIDRINPLVNAVTVSMGQQAMEMAAKADSLLAGDMPVGPLHGIPFTVKDNLDQAGYPSTWGVALPDRGAGAVNASHVAHLLKAGAIPVARTNVSDLCVRPHTDNRLFGSTLNPWNHRCSPGGSGGGDAVAVATGMSSLGIGNDLWGGLRLPAHFCGVASIRPTAGRLAAHPLPASVPASPVVRLLFTNGPMARRVSDLRIALRAMCGYDLPDLRRITSRRSGQGKPGQVMVALVNDPGDLGFDPVTRQTMESAARCLECAGTWSSG
jgi:amidase